MVQDVVNDELEDACGVGLTDVGSGVGPFPVVCRADLSGDEATACGKGAICARDKSNTS